MTSPTLRLGSALLLVLSLSAASAQGGAGLTLGWTAQVDALVVDVPPEATEVTQVAVSAEAGAETGDDVAFLELEHLAGGGAQLRGTLPDLRGSLLLQPITSEALWPCAMEATAEARFAPFTLRAVGAPATIELANGPAPDAPAAGYRQLLLLFADADVRVRGACSEAPTALQVDLYLRPGWNLVTSEVTAVGEGDTVLLRSSSDADLRGIAWRWRDIRAQRPTEVSPQRE